MSEKLSAASGDMFLPWRSVPDAGVDTARFMQGAIFLPSGEGGVDMAGETPGTVDLHRRFSPPSIPTRWGGRPQRDLHEGWVCCSCRPEAAPIPPAEWLRRYDRRYQDQSISHNLIGFKFSKRLQLTNFTASFYKPNRLIGPRHNLRIRCLPMLYVWG
ncbi:MAG: hypothetical protein ACXIVD_15885 [Salinarimonas sp.]